MALESMIRVLGDILQKLSFNPKTELARIVHLEVMFITCKSSG